MRKCLAKFSWIFVFGAVQKLSVVSSVGVLLLYFSFCGGTSVGSSGASAGQSVLESCLHQSWMRRRRYGTPRSALFIDFAASQGFYLLILRISCSQAPGTVPRIAGFHFLMLCRFHSHSQRRVPFALFSSPPSRPRCLDDVSQKRFLWFSDWIQKGKIMQIL